MLDFAFYYIRFAFIWDVNHDNLTLSFRGRLTTCLRVNFLLYLIWAKPEVLSYLFQQNCPSQPFCQILNIFDVVCKNFFPETVLLTVNSFELRRTLKWFSKLVLLCFFFNISQVWSSQMSFEPKISSKKSLLGIISKKNTNFSLFC
jgi:hypothetical protein